MYYGNIIIIGSSTGGPKTLSEIFSIIPVLNATVVIVQHIPSTIDKGFAKRLDKLSSMSIELAEDGVLLAKGKVYIAKSLVHLKLVNNSRLEFDNGEKVNYARPSVDVTMHSTQKNRSGKLIGVILTGMGRDGADGISHIKSIGGVTIAQDKETSTIYGMPMEAKKTGHVDFVLPTDEITKKLVELVGTVS